MPGNLPCLHNKNIYATAVKILSFSTAHNERSVS
ncbi:hypothetical protein EPIR_1195 [Erwinia piriflorinigrans CFBP 5888]|uniref:Uncharacterized protein n=1 Tax=Erwinia piriflorinigrans CFBP 5888 TaxID=1161919 RepID=V5Z6C2_9GAMM|nr:hypothetical protein EPIR_1195 [Erwinia piriflorinigrans CFBP 5888]